MHFGALFWVQGEEKSDILTFILDSYSALETKNVNRNFILECFKKRRK